MAKFWDLLKESVIIQGMVTLALVITICILSVKGSEISTDLWNALFSVLGFWFGSKVAYLGKVKV